MTTGPNDIQGGPQSTLKNISFYGISQALNIAVPICTIPIFTRFISPDEYGVMDMLTIVMIVGVGLGNWGLHAAFDRYFFAYSKDAQKQKRLLGSLVGFSTLCLLGVCCGAFALRGYLSARLTGAAGWGLLLIMLLASGAFRHLLTFFLLSYRNEERADQYVKYDLFRLFVTTALALVFVVIFRYGVFGIAMSVFIANTAIFLALVMKFGIYRCFTIDLAILRECLHFSWPLIGKVFLGVVNVTIDKYMIGILISMAALGVYGRANGIAYVVFALMCSSFNVYFPKWNKILFGTSSDNKTLGQLFTDHACLTSLPALFLILFSHEVVRILLPVAYRSSGPLVVVLAFYYSLLAFGQIQGIVINYLKMTKFGMLVHFFRYGLNVVLNLILIPRFGAMGAAFATLTVGIIHMSILAMVLSRKYAINYERKKLAVLYGVLLCCTAVSLCSQWSVVPYVRGLVLRIVLLGVFILVWARAIGPGRIVATARNVTGKLFGWLGDGRA